MDRKTFINRLVRGGILATMGLITAILFSRKQITLEKECGLDVQCRKCNKLNYCGLPDAEAERNDLKG
jgi:hypothetical protein